MLEINDLRTSYFKAGIETKAVDGVRLKIPPSCIFALVGESGCGKTTLGLSITDLINPKDGRIISGSVVFEGTNILKLPKEHLRDIRGKKISYIFQEPATSLNPVFKIGEQIKEVLIAHKVCKKTDTKDLTIKALGEAGLGETERVYRSYPHQLSGGMKQRAMIAMAISTKPKFLIADEPTSALDVDTEDEVLKLLLSLRKVLSLSILLITHNIGLVERIADEVAVMKDGKIREVGEVKKVFPNPKDPYTKLLLDSMPQHLKL